MEGKGRGAELKQQQGEEKGKGTLGNSLAINSDEEEVAAIAMITGAHCSLPSK